MGLPDFDLQGVDALIRRTGTAFEISSILRSNAKSMVLDGSVEGESAILKILLNRGGECERWFANELNFYSMQRTAPVDVTTPRMLAGSRETGFLLLSRIEGEPVAKDRLYPRTDITAGAPLFDALQRTREYTNWSVLHPGATVPDLLSSCRFYEEGGFVPENMITEPLALLSRKELPIEFAHRDPVPSNVIRLNDGNVALLDWEHCGSRLAGFDLAVVWAMSQGAREYRRHIHRQIQHWGERELDAFLCNLLYILGRETKNYRIAQFPGAEKICEQFALTLMKLSIALRRGMDKLSALNALA